MNQKMNPLQKWIRYLRELIDSPFVTPEDPLYDAARTGDIPKVLAILRARNEESGGRDWQLIVEFACHTGQSALLTTLIAQATHVMPEALVIASERNEAECVRVLLAHNVDPNAALENGLTPLMAAAGISSGLFKRMDDSIPIPTEQERTSGFYQRPMEEILYSLIASSRDYSKHVPHCNVEIIDLLLKYGADPNLSNRTSNTALIGAVICGNMDAVMLLIQAGADVNSSNYYRYSALKIALLKDRTDIVHVLKDAGAN